MFIRSLKENEIGDFVELYMKFIDHLRYACNEIYFDYGNDIKDSLKLYFEACLKNPLYKIYLAENNSKVVGFIAGDMRKSFFPYSKLGLNAYISAVYVFEDERKKGITKALVKHITEQFFVKNNAKYVELHCLTTNIVSKKLWTDMGFRTFREQMRLNLDSK